MSARCSRRVLLRVASDGVIVYLTSGSEPLITRDNRPGYCSLPGCKLQAPTSQLTFPLRVLRKMYPRQIVLLSLELARSDCETDYEEHCTLGATHVTLIAWCLWLQANNDPHATSTSACMGRTLEPEMDTFGDQAIRKRTAGSTYVTAVLLIELRILPGGPDRTPILWHG
jgi:hypothetical protein